MELSKSQTYLTLLIILCITSFSYGQMHTTFIYNDVKCKGPIMEEIYVPAHVKYQNKVDSYLAKTSFSKLSASRHAFYLRTAFLTKQLANSGNLLFNDSISIYLEQVKNELLKDYPSLQQQIRVHCYKSPLVNAMTLDNGLVIITTGLLAKVNSEAQLAYILGHEISHFKQEHAVNGYRFNYAQLQNNASFKKMTKVEIQKTLSARSRKYEWEADSLAFVYYASTKYNSSAPIEAFSILQNAYAPDPSLGSIQQAFELDTILSEHYFPSVKIEMDSTEIRIKEKYKDLQELVSSHPNVEKRKEKALKWYNALKENDRNEAKFIISKKWFEYCKNSARFINVKKLLDNRLYSEALYKNLLLENDFGPSANTVKNKTRALYELAKLAANGNKVQTNTSWGVNYKAFYSLDKVIMAYRICQKYKDQYSSDPYFTEIEKELLVCAKKELYYQPEDKIESIFQLDALELKTKTEDSRISRKPTFATSHTYDFDYTFEVGPTYRQGKRAYFDFYKSKNIDWKNIVWIDPEIEGIDKFNVDDKYEFIKAEQKTFKLVHELRALFKQIKKEHIVHSPVGLNTNSIHAFEQQIQMQDYLYACFEDDFRFVSANQKWYQTYRKKYNIRYLAFLHGLNFDEGHLDKIYFTIYDLDALGTEFHDYYTVFYHDIGPNYFANRVKSYLKVVK